VTKIEPTPPILSQLKWEKSGDWECRFFSTLVAYKIPIWASNIPAVSHSIRQLPAINLQLVYPVSATFIIGKSMQQGEQWRFSAGIVTSIAGQRLFLNRL
jgi:hypothetical protein